MGSSKKVTIGYKYFWGLHLVFCQGPVDVVRAIRMGKLLVWEGNVTANTTITIDKPNVFGGEKKEGGIVGDVDIEFGASTQGQNAYLAEHTDGDVPNFRGVVGNVFKRVYLTAMTRQVKPIHELISSYHAAPFNTAGNQAIGTYHINPANIIFAVANSQDFGAGKNIGLFNTASFAAAAVTLHSEGFGLSMAWEEQASADDFIEHVLDHINGVFRENLTTGFFEVKLVRDDYDLEDVPLFDESNLVEFPSFQLPSLGETINEIVVKYHDFERDKDDTVTVHNQANIAAQGAVISQTRDYPGIPTAALATRVALRDLQILSTPLGKGSIVVNRHGWDLDVGDVIKLSWAAYGLVELPARISRISAQPLDDDRIMIDFVQDVFKMPASSFMAPPTSEWVDPTGTPGDILNRSVMEATYWDAVHDLDTGALNDVANDSEVTHFMHFGMRQKSLDLGFHLFTLFNNGGEDSWIKNDVSNGSFSPMFVTDGVVPALDPVTPDDFAEVTYSSSADDELIEQLPTGALWGTLDSGSLVDIEYVSIESIDRETSTLTLKRGCVDTFPRAHADGDVIIVAGSPLNYRGFNHEQRLAQENAEIKTRAYNHTAINMTGVEFGDSAGTFPASMPEFLGGVFVDAPGRISRPYPPGNVKINDEYFPSEIVGDVELTWAHRDRIAQTVQLEHWTVGNIGPEEGVTYTVVIQGGPTEETNDGVLHVENGLTDPEFSYSENDEYLENGVVRPFLRLSVWAVRDGIESFRFEHTLEREVTFTVPLVSSTQWRIFITANNGHSNCSIAEVVFRDSGGSAISYSGGTATASSQFSGSFTPPNAFDGNNTSRWATQASPTYPQWLLMTFAGTQTVRSVDLRGPSVVSSDMVKDFEVQRWDGSAWDTVATFTGETGWTSSEVRNFVVQ